MPEFEHAHLGRQRQGGAARERRRQLRQRGAAGRAGAGLAAEERPDLVVDRLADAALEPDRDERRELVGRERHEIDRRQHERGGRGERPADDADDGAPVGRALLGLG